MDVYNLIQDQFALINHSLNTGLTKVHDEIDQLSQRVRDLERVNNLDDIQNQLNGITEKVDLLPQIHGNQVGALKTLLAGHQSQFRRLSNTVSNENQKDGYAHRQINNHEGELQQEDEYDGDEDEREEEVHSGEKDQIGGARIGCRKGDSNDLRPCLNGSLTARTTNPSLAIDPANSVNGNPQEAHNGQNTGVRDHQLATQQQRQTQSNHGQGIKVNNQVNVTPVSLALIGGNHPHFQQQQQQQQQQPQAQTNGSMTAIPAFASMSGIENEMEISSEVSTSGPIDGTDSVILNERTSNTSQSDINGRHIWENIPFRRLNPSPKSVQDVLDEYYYGYQGQPPLKYLEEHRKDWRKREKKLSKTFCRRYRIITAVETGTRLYMRDFGLRDNLARKKVVDELEELRIKSNGKKETMYWLFHNIPGHLKKK